ncbi:hypothetical protein ABEG18_15585 [Alsobacter sp. KACC 23698]|uniref:Uncharacterized protein n=1 Tax=Alsobacter sp. KACC 23698 TaxID=3149229 RepID=A0AAU7J9W0_9HYPH
MSSPIEKPLHFPLRPVRLEGEPDPVPVARLAEAPPEADEPSPAVAQAEPQTQPEPEVLDGQEPSQPQRDWSTALDMLHEAFEAVRVAESHNQQLEAAAEEARRLHRAESLAYQERIAALESRIVLAETRATEAETWLERFHTAVVEGFDPRRRASSGRS